MTDMAEPWFDPNAFGGWYGGIVGGVGGSLGGLLGALAGSLAPRGVGRTWIIGAMYVLAAFGVSQLAFGAYAWLAGQPYGIWYGPVLCGVIFTTVVGGLIPMTKMRYRQAEERRIEAAALRTA
jgi:hypothetical protein